jgi:hypothetical protein
MNIAITQAECIWLDGATPVQRLRSIPPLPPGEGGVRARQGQGERLRFMGCHMLI